MTEVMGWQQAFRSGGHQPWHLDAGLTALSFTQGYLGYTGIDRVTITSVSGSDARIGVGFLNPNGQPATAAVLHLQRMGTGTDAPWEVVGSYDTTLTLTAPAYGSTVSPPTTVGGRITGVDESLSVQVRQQSNGAPLAAVVGIPAGGRQAPWSTRLTFTAAPGQILTIAVATGGHVAPVERFAITGVTTH